MILNIKIKYEVNMTQGLSKILTKVKLFAIINFLRKSGFIVEMDYEMDLKLAKRNISTELIQNVVADHFNITVAQLLQKNRSISYVIPRQIAMSIARKTFRNKTFQDIGVEFNSFDHATVMNACKKVENYYETDKKLKDDIDK